MIASRLKIGLSACFSHADPQRSLFTGKTLQYVEQTIAHWLMSSGAMVVMVPCPTGATMRGDVTFDHYAEWLDGLVLHGGADVWPGSYGEEPLHNVAYGGTLYQDINTQVPESFVHRDAVTYDLNYHSVDIRQGSHLSGLYPGVERARVNSIHHQAIKDLAPDFEAEAYSVTDGIVEAIRRNDPEKAYIAAVQWHPEFHKPGSDTIDDTAMLEDFLRAVATSKRRPAEIGSAGFA